MFIEINIFVDKGGQILKYSDYYEATTMRPSDIYMSQ